MPLTATVI